MRAVLTDIIVRQAKPGAEIWDMACPTLGLRVGKTKKTWVVKNGSGRVSIGTYPSVSLQDARRRVSEPQSTQTTFQSLLDDFRRLYLPTIGPATAKEWERLLTKHFSHFTTIPTTREIYTKLETLKPSEANHATVPLKKMFRWGKQTGRIDSYPDITKPHKEKSRERFLTTQELKHVWNAASGTFGTIIKVCILTACRRGETQDYTLTENTVTFNDTKNSTDHTIPVTPLLHSLLSQNLQWNSWSKYKAKLDKDSGVTNYTLHDLRRTAATIMAEQLDIRAEVIEAILNHKMKGVAGIYNRCRYTQQMAEALARYEQFVVSL